MRNFTVSVVPEKEGGKVPVFLAGQVMIDIQQILMDVGEYITARELRIQKSMGKGLLSRFMLYMGEDGSINTSVMDSVTEQYGTIVDDAFDLMEQTLDALGSGVGGYWMEDHFRDAFYRNHIIYDVAALSQHMAEFPECRLLYGSGEQPKKFGVVDLQKMATFLKEKANVCGGASLGLIAASSSKSKGTMLSLICGDSKARLSFADKDTEKAALALADKGPVLIGGTLITDSEGNLAEIRDVTEAVPAESIKFRRLLAADGDVRLTVPIEAKVGYCGGTWKLSNADAGVSVAHESWDSTVQAFHDQLVFLWTEYAADGKEFEGEEAEVRDFLRSLVPQA